MTNRTQEVIRETYTYRGGDEAELRYFRNYKNTNQHVVVLQYSEENCPRVSRFATVEEARNRWRQLRRELESQGCQRGPVQVEIREDRA